MSAAVGTPARRPSFRSTGRASASVQLMRSAAWRTLCPAGERESAAGQEIAHAQAGQCSGRCRTGDRHVGPVRQARTATVRVHDRKVTGAGPLQQGPGHRHGFVGSSRDHSGAHHEGDRPRRHLLLVLDRPRLLFHARLLLVRRRRRASRGGRRFPRLGGTVVVRLLLLMGLPGYVEDDGSAGTGQQMTPRS